MWAMSRYATCSPVTGHQPLLKIIFRSISNPDCPQQGFTALVRKKPRPRHRVNATSTRESASWTRNTTASPHSPAETRSPTANVFFPIVSALPLPHHPRSPVLTELLLLILVDWDPAFSDLARQGPLAQVGDGGRRSCPVSCCS